MKKIIAILLIVALMSMVVGCKNLVPPVPYSEPTADSKDVKDIEESIGEAGTEEEDLGLDELDSLESDLDNI